MMTNGLLDPIFPIEGAKCIAEAAERAYATTTCDGLITANDKHYKYIPNLECRRFEPEHS